jgi:hypothetical protein
MGRYALVPVVLLAVFAAGCERTIDSDKAEKTIERLVVTKIGAPVQRVECPTGNTARKGDTFRCKVTGKDGSAGEVTVTETDDEGAVRVNAHFLPTDQTERSLAAELTGSGRKPVGVNCQDIIQARKGVTFDCATTAGKTTGRIHARQIDDEGRVRYRPLKKTD